MSVLAHLRQAGKSSQMGTDQHREPVVMWGAGGHATVVAESIHSIPGFVLAGVLVDHQLADHPADLLDLHELLDGEPGDVQLRLRHDLRRD